MGSVVEIRGAVGPTRLQFEEPLSSRVPVRKLAEATVKSVVRVDGRLANIRADFTLANLSPNENLFTVQLPPRSVLLSVGSNAKYLVRDGSVSSPRIVLRVDKRLKEQLLLRSFVNGLSVPPASSRLMSEDFPLMKFPAWRQWGPGECVC